MRGILLVDEEGDGPDAAVRDASADAIEDRPDLGPCCCCGRGAPDVLVRSIIQLHHKSPLAGRGWACLQCGLAADGAVAVVCEECFGDTDAFDVARLRWACRGYPSSDGRVPIADLVGVHAHDRRYHPEAADA